MSKSVKRLQASYEGLLDEFVAEQRFSQRFHVIEMIAQHLASLPVEVDALKCAVSSLKLEVHTIYQKTAVQYKHTRTQENDSVKFPGQIIYI